MSITKLGNEILDKAREDLSNDLKRVDWSPAVGLGSIGAGFAAQSVAGNYINKRLKRKESELINGLAESNKGKSLNSEELAKLLNSSDEGLTKLRNNYKWINRGSRLAAFTTPVIGLPMLYNYYKNKEVY